VSREREKKVYVVTDHREGESRRTWRDALRGIWAVFCLVMGAIAALIGAVLGTRQGVGSRAAQAVRDAYMGRAGDDEESEGEDDA
jgi:hypothetical protein